jgi:hypothetical protein
MSSESSAYIKKMLPLLDVQIRPIECARQYKNVSEKKHLEAIAGGLRFARDPLRYAIQALWTAGESPIAQHLHETLHKELMCGIFFLMSALDAMIIMDTVSSSDLSANMSFFTTSLRNTQQRKIQEDIKELRSYQKEENTKSASILTVTNFFKHYMPSCWMPKTFIVNQGRRIVIQDFFLCFEGEESGPIMYDLVIPTYNMACDLFNMMALECNLELDVRKISAE